MCMENYNIISGYVTKLDNCNRSSSKLFISMTKSPIRRQHYQQIDVYNNFDISKKRHQYIPDVSLEILNKFEQTMVSDFQTGSEMDLRNKDLSNNMARDCQNVSEIDLKYNRGISKSVVRNNKKQYNLEFNKELSRTTVCDFRNQNNAEIDLRMNKVISKTVVNDKPSTSTHLSCNISERRTQCSENNRLRKAVHKVPIKLEPQDSNYDLETDFSRTQTVPSNYNFKSSNDNNFKNYKIENTDSDECTIVAEPEYDLPIKLSATCYEEGGGNGSDVLYDDGDDTLEQSGHHFLIDLSLNPSQYLQEKDDSIPEAPCIPPQQPSQLKSLLNDKNTCNFKCNVCLRSYPTHARLKIHFKTHKKKIYVCKHCEKTFKNSVCFKKHELMHSVEPRHIPKKAMKMRTHSKKLQCDICAKVFTRVNNLEKHMMVHTGDRPHTCDVCGKGFTELRKLNVHKELHSGTKEYVCDLCDRAFTQRAQLINHKLKHKGVKAFSCDICQDRFARPAELRSHQAVHKGPFTCEQCDKKFKTMGNLKEHYAVHSELKSFVCDVCRKGFKREYDLRRHKLIHSDVRSHMCPTCGKGFTLARYLRQHQVIHTIALLSAKTSLPE